MDLGWVTGTDWLRAGLLLRLLLAAVLGGLVGLERELSGKPAGFRTNLLICVGAALLTDLSLLVAARADPLQTAADPARIAAQIVSGIGFLGAGTIIQARGSVVGLTTAATLWVVAAIGMAVGARAYVEAVGATVLVIAALIVLGRVEERLISARADRRIRVTVDPRAVVVTRVREALEASGLEVETVEVDKAADAYVASFVASGETAARENAIAVLLDLPGVHKLGR